MSPLLVATFGPLPVASLPANVLAGPAAGPVMVWGLTGGLVAGLVGGPLATALHLPTRLMLDLARGRRAAAPPSSRSGPSARPTSPSLAAGLALLLVTRHRPATTPMPGPGPAGRAAAGRAGAAEPSGGSDPGASAGRSSALAPGGTWARGGPWVRRIGVGLVAAALVGAAWPRPPATGPVELGLGATAWRGREASVLVADGRARAEAVLGGLREAGVGRLDAVVLRSNARSTADLVAVLRRRWPRVNVVAPPAADGRAPPPGAVALPAGTAVAVGDLAVAVTTGTPGHLEVSVTSGPGGPTAVPGMKSVPGGP